MAKRKSRGQRTVARQIEDLPVAPADAREIETTDETKGTGTGETIDTGSDRRRDRQ